MNKQIHVLRLRKQHSASLTCTTTDLLFGGRIRAILFLISKSFPPMFSVKRKALTAQKSVARAP